ncbi:MAG: restriction endonuclease subunit S [Bacteroidales bacterium]|nr:restriction endonuclease subunit S [Bacteroidales bacterium]
MEEITTALLKDLVKRKIGYGIVQPGDSSALSIPVVKVNNLISGLSDTASLDKTTETISNKYTRTILQGGELLVSVVGTIGKTAIVPSSFAGCNIARAVAMIDIPDEILTLWVKYYIDSPQGQSYIMENLNTTVQPTLNIKDLENLPIPLCNQKHIERRVMVLKTMDDKIALNNRINHNLCASRVKTKRLFFVFRGAATNSGDSRNLAA